MTSGETSSKFTRCDPLKVDFLFYFAELSTTWFSSESEQGPSVDRPIAITSSIWAQIAECIDAVKYLWASKPEDDRFPYTFDLKPHVIPESFYVSAKTWAQAACFLEETFDTYSTEQFAGSSDLVEWTLLRAHHAPETVQEMINHADFLCPEFWTKWFQFETGAIFYESIDKDCLLPLAQRMWRERHTPGDSHSFIGYDGRRYARRTLPPITPDLKDTAPAIYTFYMECRTEAHQALKPQPKRQ
jgi:hypothetical protein